MKVGRFVFLLFSISVFATAERIDLILQKEVKELFYKPIRDICDPLQIPFHPSTIDEQRRVIQVLNPHQNQFVSRFKSIFQKTVYTFDFNTRVEPTDILNYPLYQQFLYLRGMEEDLLEFILDRSPYHARTLHSDWPNENQERELGALRTTLFETLRSNPETVIEFERNTTWQTWTIRLKDLFPFWKMAFTTPQLNEAVSHYPSLTVSEENSIQKHTDWKRDIYSSIGIRKCVRENNAWCVLAIIDRYSWRK